MKPPRPSAHLMGGGIVGDVPGMPYYITVTPMLVLPKGAPVPVPIFVETVHNPSATQLGGH